MIIDIDESFELYLKNNELSKNELAKLIDLLMSFQRGFVFLRASPDFYNDLADCYHKEIGEFLYRFIKAFIVESYTIINDYKDIKPLYILCDKQFIKNDNYFGKKVTLLELPDSYIPLFMCENVLDNNFYLEIYKIISNHKFIRSSNQHTGGCSMTSLIDNLDKNAVIFSVFDSDQKYPGGPLGDTCKCARRVFKKTTNKHSYMYVLGVHEKENLLPVNYYISKEASKNRLISILSASSDNAKNHFDIKDGVKKKKLTQNAAIENWKKIYLPVIEEMKNSGFYDDSGDDESFLFKGIGSNFLSNKKNIKKFTKERLYKDLTEKQKHDWDIIIDVIQTYCAQFEKFSYI